MTLYSPGGPRGHSPEQHPGPEAQQHELPGTAEAPQKAETHAHEDTMISLAESSNSAKNPQDSVESEKDANSADALNITDFVPEQRHPGSHDSGEFAVYEVPEQAAVEAEPQAEKTEAEQSSNKTPAWKKAVAGVALVATGVGTWLGIGAANDDKSPGERPNRPAASASANPGETVSPTPEAPATGEAIDFSKLTEQEAAALPISAIVDSVRAENRYEFTTSLGKEPTFTAEETLSETFRLLGSVMGTKENLKQVQETGTAPGFHEEAHGMSPDFYQTWAESLTENADVIESNRTIEVEPVVPVRDASYKKVGDGLWLARVVGQPSNEGKAWNILVIQTGEVPVSDEPGRIDQGYHRMLVGEEIAQELLAAK